MAATREFGASNGLSALEVSGRNTRASEISLFGADDE